MTTVEIKKGQPSLESIQQIFARGKLFVNDVHTRRPEDVYCGLLQFASYDAANNTTMYSVIGNGCIMVYLTDCHGILESGTPHTCVRGGLLSVEGCHSFGCGC
jgi:hypothetical protein